MGRFFVAIEADRAGMLVIFGVVVAVGAVDADPEFEVSSFWLLALSTGAAGVRVYIGGRSFFAVFSFRFARRGFGF